MDRNQTIFGVLAALLVVALLGSPVACTMHRQRLVADAIKGGADPIAARCAIEGPSSTTDNTMCIVRVISHK